MQNSRYMHRFTCFDTYAVYVKLYIYLNSNYTAVCVLYIHYIFYISGLCIFFDNNREQCKGLMWKCKM